MLIGYGRVSTVDQNLDLQLDALKAAGCDKVFTDQLSGVKEDRPGLDEALRFARTGDTLAVWRLDRLGRSLPHLIEVVNGLEARGVGFKSLTESLDTTTSTGKLIFAIFGALAQFERDLIRERTMAGLAAARARGRTGGRKRQVTDAQAALIRDLVKDRTQSVGEICEALGIGRSTFYRYAGGDAMETEDGNEGKARKRMKPTREDTQAVRDAFLARRRSTIHGATMMGDLNLVRSFLDAGVDVNTLDPHGITPLVRAAQYGRMEIIQLLIERGADLSSDGGHAARALTGAVACGHLEAVRALLEAGVDPNVRLGHETVNSVKPQPDGSVAYTYRKESGETALHKAVAFRRTEIIRLLLERGADVNAINDDGRTPRDLTRQGRAWTEIVQMLKDAGA